MNYVNNVKIKDVCGYFGVTKDKVRQIDSKQLFIVDLPTGRALVSYLTIVGKFINGKWHLTTTKYSVTTSKQLTQFASRTAFKVVWSDAIDEDK